MMVFDKTKFGIELRVLRAKRNGKYKNMSELFGISKPTYAKLENAQSVPSMKIFVKSLELMDKKATDFIYEIRINE